MGARQRACGRGAGGGGAADSRFVFRDRPGAGDGYGREAGFGGSGGGAGRQGVVVGRLVRWRRLRGGGGGITRGREGVHGQWRRAAASRGSLTAAGGCQSLWVVADTLVGTLWVGACCAGTALTVFGLFAPRLCVGPRCCCAARAPSSPPCAYCCRFGFPRARCGDWCDPRRWPLVCPSHPLPHPPPSGSHRRAGQDAGRGAGRVLHPRPPDDPRRRGGRHQVPSARPLQASVPRRPPHARGGMGVSAAPHGGG